MSSYVTKVDTSVLTQRLARDVPTTLVRGRMEGWVRIRIAGQTDWKRVWMVVSAGTDGATQVDGSAGGARAASPPALSHSLTKKKRISALFLHPTTSRHSGSTKPIISVYASQKPRDRKKPLLTLKHVTQVFAVYPERPEVITKSTLIKIEGLFGEEETVAAMKQREGWLLIMPELEGGLGEAAEMLKWVVGGYNVMCFFVLLIFISRVNSSA